MRCSFALHKGADFERRAAHASMVRRGGDKIRLNARGRAESERARPAFFYDTSLQKRTLPSRTPHTHRTTYVVVARTAIPSAPRDRVHVPRHATMRCRIRRGDHLRRRVPRRRTRRTPARLLIWPRRGLWRGPQLGVELPPRMEYRRIYGSIRVSARMAALVATLRRSARVSHAVMYFRRRPRPLRRSPFCRLLRLRLLDDVSTELLQN